MSGATAAQAPAGGMQRIPLPLESYQHPSLPLASKRLVNLYSEKEPADARSQAALIPTAGMSFYRTLSTGPIWAMNGDIHGLVYVASGTRFYRLRYTIDGPFVDDLGDIGIPDRDVIPDYDIMITIASGPPGVVVCVPPRSYTCDHSAMSVNQIGGDYPGAAAVCFHDGYYVYTGYDQLDQFFISKLGAPGDFDALDFASSDALPNVLRRVVSHRGDLWMLGEGSLEVWYDAGSSGLETTPGISFFPYRRRPGTVLTQHVATCRSYASGDGSIFWLGDDNIAYRSNGYQAVRISTHAEEAMIRVAYDPVGQHYGAYACVSAFFYAEDGHSFWVLNFPEKTLVYDCATGVWHDRASGDGGTGRWRANAVARVTELVLFGDGANGNIYADEPYRDNEGSNPPLTRIMTMPPLWAATRRAFCARLEVEMETQLAGDVTLRWSNDGGFTWPGGPRMMTVGRDVDLRKRIYTTRLGSFRQRVFQITTASRSTFYAVDADIQAGSN